MWQMIGVLAELERSLMTERTRAGVKAARQRGVQFGPKPQLTPQQITHARQLRAQGEPVQVIAALLNVHRATIYRVLADEDTSPFPGLPGAPEFASFRTRSRMRMDAGCPCFRATAPMFRCEMAS